MIRYTIIVLFFAVFTSCATFNRPHYRHVSKVPAHSNYASALSSNQEFTSIPLNVHRDTVTHFSDSNSTLVDSDSTLVSGAIASEGSQQKLVHRDLNPRPQERAFKKMVAPKNLRRDWSLLVAILWIVAGIFLLTYMVGILFVTPILLVVRIILSAIFGVIGIRAIVSGVSIFFNHFRSRKNFEET